MRIRNLFVNLALAAVVLACFAVPAGSQTTIDAIKARLIGQPLLLRGFWLDDDLRFDSAGKPIQVYKTGSFTESGVDAIEVKRDGDRLIIQGRRVGILFDRRGAERIIMRKPKMFTGVPEQITVVIDGGGNTDFSQGLDAVFTSSIYDIVPALPECWQPFARQSFEPAGSQKKHPGDMVLPNGPDGQKPRAARPPALPASTAPANSQDSDGPPKGNFAGTVELFLWIGADGRPNSITIIRPLGHGYDEKAVDAVAHYRFKPSRFGTHDVATDVYISVNFRVL